MNSTLERAEVSLPSEHEVLVRRRFSAPREVVYRALTTPALIQRWLLGPPGWSMPVCEMDVRVGGRFRWRWRNDEDGREFGFHGEYREVDPPRRIVSMEYFDPGDVGGSMGDGALITLELAERDGATILSTRMDYFTREARDQALSTGMTDGMEMSYSLLDELLREG